jgi:mannan endo-1,4-beta-mannosidase
MPARHIITLIFITAMLFVTEHMPQALPVAEAAGPSIYWGALIDGKAPTSTNMQPGGPFATFETRSNKKMAIIHWGQPWMMSDGSWGEFQTSYFDNVRNHGSIPMLNWTSWRLGSGTTQPDFQLRDVYGGKYDTYLNRWATAAKNWGHPFFLRFNHEMNGWWYPWGEGKLADGTIVNGNSPGDFVKAWQHVHNIFTNVGATNVTWVWAPNQIANNTRYPVLSTLYPGSSYVDWTGLSIYNKYTTWLGLNPLLNGAGYTWLKNSYNEVLSVTSTKPMMLAEFASIEAGDGGAKKAAWLQDALTAQIPTNFPKVKAVVWFNWDADAGKTYPIESSQAATAAWAAGIGSPIYATNQYASLNISPIPALTALATTGSSASFVAVTDTYIDSSNPASTAGGTSSTLHTDGSPLKKAFLRFDLTPLAGRTISSVKLRIKTASDNSAGATTTANIKAVTDVLWKEQYMSYSNSVTISSTVLGKIPANSVPGTWYEITLSPSAVQQNVGGLISMAIEATSADGILLNSRETADQPQLIISYS